MTFTYLEAKLDCRAFEKKTLKWNLHSEEII